MVCGGWARGCDGGGGVVAVVGDDLTVDVSVEIFANASVGVAVVAVVLVVVRVLGEGLA